MKLRNEEGVTLVELLAVLVLVAMVGTLIMTTFFIATRYNLTETKKLKMQQDANYIVTTILQKHRTVEDCYTLELKDDGELVYIDCDTPENEEVIGKDFDYKLIDIEFDDGSSGGKLDLKDGFKGPIEMKPKEKHVNVKLIVTDTINEKLSVEVDTTFKRYKTRKGGS